MNLGFIFENFAIIQLWLLNTPDYKPTHADKKSFLEFYENQLNHVAEDFCVKANDISEKLLKNYTLSMNSTLEQQEFKQFLQDFQRDYYHIKRYKQYEPLSTAFINVLIFNYHIEPEDEDDIKEYKFQKMIEQNFADLLKEYESNSTKFFKEKFIPKCEELKQHLSSKQLIELYRTIDRLAACESYHCFPTNINTILMQIDVNYDIIAKYQKLQLKKGLIYFIMELDNASKNILKDKHLTELSFEVKQNLTQDINDFIQRFANNYDIELFALTFESENLYFLKKYYNNKNFSLNDRQILNQILENAFSNSNDDNDVGSNDLHKNYIIYDLVYKLNMFDHYLTDRISSYTDLFYV